MYVNAHKLWFLSINNSLTFRKIVFKSWGSALFVACTYKTTSGNLLKQRIQDMLNMLPIDMFNEEINTSEVQPVTV